ncbi:AMP-binding protein [Gordonia sp. FQ]|uniref:AMP-binding protein n=1 Tax=Gordonia sp. FQ TaxID=3446634 RepID=UPI003F86B177
MTSADVTSATLAELFAGVVAAHGAAPALACGRRRLGYAELAGRVTAAAAAFGDDSSRPLLVTVPPATDGDAFEEAVVALVAALVSGRPVVPVDAALPAARVRTITERADVSLPGCAILVFTSGSTGEPKAVRQGPGMWRHQIAELSADLDIGPGRTVVSALPLSFGGGLDIALTALFTGATLVPVDPRDSGVDGLLATIDGHAPDGLHLSPHLLRQVTAHPAAADALTAVRLTCTCGEAPDGADLAALRAVAPHLTYVNRAGSSETGNLASNVFPPGRPIPDGTVIPGRPAAGKTLVIRDDAGRRLGDGQVGRIEVVSEFLADGYLVDGVPVDFATDESGARRYPLGDAGTLTGGELRLAGRLDDAVKIRGYLVDVSEVTAAVRRCPGIGEAAVIARGAPAELVAYLVPAPGARPPSIAAVRTALTAALPGWMRPAHYVLLPQLPRTERGKLDRQALPAPDPRPDHVPPRTRTQRLLAPLWEDLLAVTAVGADDDFAALGGDSLTAVVLIDRIDDCFGVRLSPADLAAAPTLASCAARIDAAGQTGDARTGRPLPRDTVLLSPARDDGPIPDEGPLPDQSTARPLVVVFAGAGESVHAFMPLARHLPDFTLVGLGAHALERRGIPDYTIGRAVRRAVRQVRALSPHGPYRFVGHSIGGVIAMETARRLEAAGGRVEHVVCLDTVLDDALRRRAPIDFPEPVPTAPANRPEPAPSPSSAARWRTRLRLLTAGWWPRPAHDQWALFHELGRRSALLHRLRPWPGPVTLIKAEENDDPDDWWPLLAPGTVSIDRVPGDHAGMLRPPYATATAALVERALAGHGSS